MTVLFLELNEINFEYVLAYGKTGKLPALNRLIAAHGVSETVSEQKYEELEPWIQWVTAHTGMTLAQHGVFRLGDIVDEEIDQIWEVLERQGLTVGAISPMNAKNRCHDAAFFVPDPWTSTKATGGSLLQRLHRAIAQAVNDNAQARLSPTSAMALVHGVLSFARYGNYGRYFSLAAGARKKSWAKALFLDLLLGDVFIREVRRTKPAFASLFLNAGAHIQHHYLFNSFAYSGDLTNPEWYVPSGLDPVLEVYELYDHIVADVVDAFPNARIMLATGLHQNAYGEVTFYWRPKDHEALLRKLEVPFMRVEARMSRDFMIYCSDLKQAEAAERRLRSTTAIDGQPIFEIDNRGTDLFVMLVWPHDVPNDFEYRIGNEYRSGLREELAFVAIKNGEHDGVGYLVDTGQHASTEPRLPLTGIPARIAHACGARWQPEQSDISNVGA
ncbi:MAG: hypothetical protein V4530_01405 [Pseudomonadota bacterium]